MSEQAYIITDFEDNDVSLDSQGTASIISALDILLLKKEINNIDIRIQNEISEKIWRLGNLEEGWDSYQGAPISDNAVINAFLFISRIVDEGLILKRPIVSPEPNGGVILKWRDGKREFLAWFTPNKKNFIYVEVYSGIRTGNKLDSLDGLFAIFKKWLSEGSQ